MRGVFVTGTGTDIGKTVVSFQLLRRLHRAGQDPLALKPVASGLTPADWPSSDPGRLLQALERPVTQEQMDLVCPFRFAAPLAPTVAARREGQELDAGAIIHHVRRVASDRWVLVEGAGGVRVPLDARTTMRELARTLGLPALLVVGTYLGSISHTVTALDSLAAVDVPVAAVVINEVEPGPMPTEELEAALRPFTGSAPILRLPRLDDPWFESDRLDDWLPALQTPLGLAP